MPSRSRGHYADTAADLLRGAIDMHVHTAPDVYPRSVGAVDAARQAKEAGMAAIVLKSHSTDTAGRAEIVSKLTGIPVYGGVALNYPVGGVNPHAVSESVRQGGRIVWLPTTSARHFLAGADNAPTLQQRLSDDQPGIEVTSNGELSATVERVVSLIARHQLVLASGHLAPPEILAVMRYAHELGADRLVVTHPHAEFVGCSVDDMRELAALGAVHEMLYTFTTKAIDPPQKLSHIADLIRAVGVEHCYLATDGGQAVNPLPVEMFRSFIEGLLALGFSADELRYMTHDVPARLLA